jgi:hypothetical protein
VPSGLRNNLILAAVLVISRATQRDTPLAHAIVATAASNASQRRSLASIILVNVKPDIHQALRTMADIDILEVLNKVVPLHPEKAVICHRLTFQSGKLASTNKPVNLALDAKRTYHLSTFALVLDFFVLIPQRRPVRPVT